MAQEPTDKTIVPQIDVAEQRRQQRRTLIIMWLRNQAVCERNFNRFEQAPIDRRPLWEDVTAALIRRLEQQRLIFSELFHFLDVPSQQATATQAATRALEQAVRDLRRRARSAKAGEAVDMHRQYSELYDKLFAVLQLCGMSDEDWATALQDSQEPFIQPQPVVSKDEDTGDADTWDPDKFD